MQSEDLLAETASVAGSVVRGPCPERAPSSGPAASPREFTSAGVPSAPLMPAGASKADRDKIVAELLERHHVVVWRTLLRLGLNEDRAHDAALEVFVVASNKLEMIERGRERNFLLSTAVRIAANFRRASWVRHEVASETTLEQELDPTPAADQLLYQRQLRRQLDEILASLPDDIRAVFVLFEFEGLSAPEIAEVTGIKLGTVASRLRRARQLFRQSVTRLRTRGLIEGPMS